MKPQALKLVEHLNSGGTVTRESALADFGIQNITARLSELQRLGFDIIKTPYKALRGGRGVKITSWQFRHCILPGCHVCVKKEINIFVLLKGRTGVVHTIDLNSALACIHISGMGYRQIPFNCLKRLYKIPVGTRVSIKPDPYVVMDYHHDINSYTLTSPNPEHTMVIHSNLVEAYA